ncbi:hypothetical protein [Sphingobacterium yanglingense]|uniref:Uncharacterized protein n=1 Tax=Sphingobacterium yanglingense TaxID=1437280 RepID=A0A4R6WUU6_9SPHI|nr:hypothetical protein [Sphingobacterium yanglingense]TDQ82842.1 hypothetical protein CLV99_0064 [Sphingobacterium yanglingense]
MAGTLQNSSVPALLINKEMIKEIITEHALRRIILLVDEDKVAPEFEKNAIEVYYEMHDRVLQWEERLRIAREKIPGLGFKLERVEEVYEDARRKLEHLLVMVPENPERPRIRMQLRTFTQDLDRLLCEYVPELINQAGEFYEYEDYSLEEDIWMTEIAFKEFRTIFDDYENCAVDMVSFDRDLDDFKGVLGHIRKREGKYYDMMYEYIDTYTDLNEKIDSLYDRVDEFDDTILEFIKPVTPKGAE